ncbi:alpha/beta hydrolase [Streptomyces sp. AC563]|uniref:alpha/beta fold hydrolase n=1 Tax=Streptomyces buecherae TaxID=2763006 RepID=UPI00164E8AB1|nr:alpha/beta hydrolase [Streptomyces buecherae]MBC3990946.1 alpha/beta hydrolase [Streptomyces buecherae]
MRHDRVTANGIDFSYVEEGDGPLALLLHGMVETPHVYRHLIPVLAEAGYRAVAPSMRGFAPTQIPPDGSMRLADLVADANGLHEALGGDANAVIVGSDWGAYTTWGATAQAPDRWAKAVVATIPPARFLKPLDPAMIHKLGHFFFFQMVVAEQIVPQDDFAYLDWLWDYWSGSLPGVDLTPDLAAGKDAVRDPARLRLALELYRQNFPVQTYGTDRWEGGELLAELPTQPTLYLHGSEDPSTDRETLAKIVAALPAGSDGAMLEGVGHFPFIENPDEVNRRVRAFLTG